MYKVLSSFFFLTLFLIHHNSFSKPFEYDDVTNVKILFTKTSYKTYQNLLSTAHFESNKEGMSGLLHDKFKKDLKITGSYIDNKGIEKHFSGIAKITGNSNDHLDYPNKISSLNIHLKKGNLGGIIKFRLLLPKTRGDTQEIIWSLILQHAGYPQLERKFLNINLMGKNHEFILEEKPTKEFLESNGFREGPIVKVDDRQLWFNRFQNKGLFNPFQLKIDNQTFIKNNISALIAYQALYPDFDTDLIKNFDLVNLINAEHGMFYNNKKYIYDVIYNEFIPIYNDGNVFIPEKLCFSDGKQIFKYDPEIAAKVELIKTDFKKKTNNKNLPENFVCLAKNILSILQNKNTSYNKKIKPLEKKIHKIDEQYSFVEPVKININKNNAINFPEEIKKTIKPTKTKHYQAIFEKNNKPSVINYDYINEKISDCKYDTNKNYWSKCNEIKNSNIKKILAGQEKHEVIEEKNITKFLNIEYKPQIIENFIQVNLHKDRKKFIFNKKNSVNYIEINAKNSDIEINTYNDASVVINNSNILDSTIILKNFNQNKLNNDIRYNEKLLTGCITFINTLIENTVISNNYCNKEDSVNFIKSKGKKISIFIEKADFDGIDADFSNLQFNQIEVISAGNDCVDFSSGIYIINKINLEYCGDKAISAGEKSTVSLIKGNIFKTNIGIASKDQSKVYLGNDIKILNKKTCLTHYQKKQEFGDGEFIINGKLDNCKIKNSYTTSLNSRTKYCKYVDMNKYIHTCLTDNNLIIKSTLPENIDIDVFFNNKKHELNKKCTKQNCLYSTKITKSYNLFSTKIVDSNKVEVLKDLSSEFYLNL